LTPGLERAPVAASHPDADVLPVIMSADPGRAGSPAPSIVRALGPLRQAVDQALVDHGGVLFRGYEVAGSEGFRAFARAFGHPLVSYDFGSTPRTRVSDGVYSSTEYPAHQQIPLHNEQSYTRDWPMKIWFHCQLAAALGGETPIADSRKVYRRVDAGIRERFCARGLLYVRNYGNGLDLPWQRVFDTNDPGAVEAYCAAHGIAHEWTRDGELRTRQIAQATMRHPYSHEMVWFNQAHLFHPSALEPAVREALLEVVDHDELPRNVYYGDGNPIEDGVLDEIRGVYAELQVVFPWQSGDVLMLDNMLVAHGRTAFTGDRKVIVAMAEPHVSGA
jgi:alpha-ketoglutarate-dependent taurine dioxygenase